MSLALAAIMAAGEITFPLPRVPPGKPKPKLYVPPKIEEEPVPTPGPEKVVAVPEESELPIVVRPAAGAPMVGAAMPGTRLPIRGAWEAPTPRGCSTRRWFAIDPRGWVCSTWVRRTEGEPSTKSALEVADGEVVPYRYVMVGLKDEKESTPMWPSIEAVKLGQPPTRELRKGDTVAVTEKNVKFEGQSYWIAEDGAVLKNDKVVFTLRKISQWQGLPLDATTPLPFGWVTPEKAKVYDGPGGGAQLVETIDRRTRVPILEEVGEKNARRIRIGEGRWMRPVDVNEVRLLPRPPLTLGADRWIDVDLGEQVLVAYEGEMPVYATLVSAGRSMPTPRGDYPIWAKVSQITMKSQAYEDKPYYVDRVPWALFFQAHNAIHAAYWHDKFGVSKSHGCVNAAPKDARWLFEWIQPGLPAAWSGTRTPNLLEGPVVHVRNSRLKIPIAQERIIGPPDRDEEKLKREEADARRLAEAQAAAAAAATEPGTPPPPLPPPPVIAPTADPR